VFNGPVEVGLRTLVLLLEVFPETLDLQHLVTLDYLLIHSGDFEDGPQSLHPPSPMRAGEIAVRRGLIEDGLHLYRARGLIEQVPADTGFGYRAAELTAPFLDALVSPYAIALRERATWIFETLGQLPFDELQQILDEALGRWRTEFAVLGELEGE
jgi:hypothetical protein